MGLFWASDFVTYRLRYRIFCVPKGNRTVVNIEEFPAIPLAVVA